jgi:Ankyrin repeats (3 copies)/Ankyrin repeat
VFCQLEVLRQCFPPSVRRILEELPDSLDETYERILREIRKPNQGHAHQLMQCLVAAVRPLRVEELAEILAFDFKAKGIPKINPGWRWEDQEEAVMSACSSLVMIVNDGDSRIVQFSHFSVKEFLTANRLAEPIRDVSRYHIRLEAAHTILAQACLGVLLRLDDRVDRDNVKNFPLARYAAEYWPTHARFENALSCVKDGIECLFDVAKPHFASWLWVYNEDRPSPFTSPSKPAMCPGKPEAVPLYYAARLGFRDLAERLIAEHPEHVNARAGIEVTPTHAAASAGHAGMLSLLLDHGADLEGPGFLNGTPLHRASVYGKLEAGHTLLDRGADIHARDETDRTPLFFAAFNGHVEFFRMLLERGARIDARDGSGKTALHFAVDYHRIRVMRLLLEHGADVNARDESGKTPSQLTSSLSYPEVAGLLSEYGAESIK